MNITKRETLLECLDIMKKIRNSFSRQGFGITPIDRYSIFYEEYDNKCQILREMIQALESEPVRTAMAKWQSEVMKKGPEALESEPVGTAMAKWNREVMKSGPQALEMDRLQMKVPEDWDKEDYTGNNAPIRPLKGQVIK